MMFATCARPYALVLRQSVYEALMADPALEMRKSGSDALAAGLVGLIPLTGIRVRPVPDAKQTDDVVECQNVEDYERYLASLGEIIL